MSAEPVVIYSHRVDPAGVARLLTEMAPDCEVIGPPEGWRSITIRGPARLLRRRSTLSFTQDPTYYAGSDWPRQMLGMRGYFSRFPRNHNAERVMLLIGSFRFALSLFPVPEPDLYIDSDDPRLRYVFAVARYLDGALFVPSGLRAAAGRVLYGADEPDPAAVMPAILREVAPVPRAGRVRSEGGTLPDEGDAPPPTPTRVARRACALAAVTARALLEQDSPDDPLAQETQADILAWVDALGLGEELEPEEGEFLRQPLGAPALQVSVNSTWRLEGLAVLAWALGRFDLPPADQLVVPRELLRSLGILDEKVARELLECPILRSREELETQRDRLFAVHWRLTDWRVKPRAMDFVGFASTAWFGPLDLTGLRLVERDLAVGDLPLFRASADLVADATSAAMERHLAANWLLGGSALYSETEVST